MSQVDDSIEKVAGVLLRIDGELEELLYAQLDGDEIWLEEDWLTAVQTLERGRLLCAEFIADKKGISLSEGSPWVDESDFERILGGGE